MFVILWQYEVKPGNRQRFQNAYGPHGHWVQLFARDPHFRGTQLLHHASDDCRFFTLDFWDSEPAYRAFLDAHQDAYKQLDSTCEELTLAEHHVLSFELDPAILRPS